MSVFVDTNVWVYRVDRGEPQKRARAREVLTELDPGDIVVSAQVLAEFYVTVSRKLAIPMSPADAASAVNDLAALQVVPQDRELVLGALTTCDRHQISLWDSMIVRAAVIGGCETLLTEDLADATVIDGVAIENPFL